MAILAKCCRFEIRRRVLDIAASHGYFGIAFACENAEVQITGVDSAQVLEFARRNAEKAGVGDRYNTWPGSAFDLDRSGFDLALLANIVLGFDKVTNLKLLEKIYGAIEPGGHIAVNDMMLNDDKTTPSGAAGFAFSMLAMIPAGEAYTVSEIATMLTSVGSRNPRVQDLPINRRLVLAVR